MPDPKRGRILNVDDNEAGRYTTTKILKNVGFEVIEASNGTDALTLAANHHPDIVLLDVNLPDISGFEVCKKLKQDTQTSSILVVHQSATFVKSPDKVQGLEGGADGYLVHPIEPEVLVATLRSFLRIRNAEKALRESEERYRRLFETAQDGILILDEETGKIIDANTSILGILGYPLEYFVGKDLWEVGFIKDKSIAQRAFTELKASGYIRLEDLPLVTKKGQSIEVEFISNVYLVGEKKIIQCNIRDITARKRTEDAFRQLHVDHMTMIANAPAMIWYKDTKNIFIRVNPAGARVFGLPIDEIEGKSAYDLFPDFAEKYYQDDLEVINSGKPKLGIIEPMTTASGEHLWVQSDKIPLIDEQGTINRILLFVLDITERKRAEDALLLARRKLTLLSGITRHDIRNQILVLSANLEFSKEVLGDPARTSEYIAKEEKILETIGHQISFTKDYEDLGVKASVWQNVSTVIKKGITSLPMRDIQVDTGDPDLEVYADPMLEKVFYNLFDNTLRYGGEQMTAIRVTARQDNEMMVIAVEDDGTGIVADDKKQLFTKGFGRNTGLGLYLCREILSITGITITENGVPGRGARFEITVPKGMYRFPGLTGTEHPGGVN